MKYEDLLLSMADWISRYKLLTARDEKYDSLTQELDEIYELLNHPTIAAPLNNFSIREVSTIDKLALGDNLISLYEGGLSCREVADTLSKSVGMPIKTKEVESYIEKFKKGSISTQRQQRSNSVFDTKNRMEDLLMELNELLFTLKLKTDEDFSRGKASREQVMVEVLREMRMTVSDAAAIIKTYANLAAVKEVIDIIIQSLPDKDKAQVYRVLRDKSALFMALE